MRKSVVAAVRLTVAAASVMGFSAMVGSGVAQAGPQDCVVSRDLVGASVSCHDTGAPASREYSLVVECWGLAGIPNAFPLMGIGPYQGSWSGAISPTGQGSASCIGPYSIGTATNAYVLTYRE
ncbi:hypothetical protein [Nocardia caishijiensis]|uniref:Ig-like domain-containing protein n=1 Tax=Nocardia caishijiensis TaxID=184756 RepID=A0ABQ6YFB0_9NOCA|nr:hypothetical protein [Nocardia caishijiensis]KAF0836577.1 hypothetical protein FNL39_11478 [Nocardia caishijiensis]